MHACRVIIIVAITRLVLNGNLFSSPCYFSFLCLWISPESLILIISGLELQCLTTDFILLINLSFAYPRVKTSRLAFLSYRAAINICRNI